jgi:hypothetical protein
MSDLQLALLIKGYCARLELALDRVRERMPEDAEREHVPVYRGDPGSLTGRLFKSNWEVVPTGEYTLLRPVADLIEEMKAEAMRLEGLPVPSRETPPGEAAEGEAFARPRPEGEADKFTLTAPLPAAGNR